MHKLASLRTYITGLNNQLHLIDSPRWHLQVKQIIVLLSAPRSGSSVLFDALTTAPNIIAPAGEHEPWLFLSENRYPFVESDEVHAIRNLAFLRRLLRNDLLVRESAVDGRELCELIHNRLVVRQSPYIQLFDNAIASKYIYKVVDMPTYRQLLSEMDEIFVDGRSLVTNTDQLDTEQHYLPIEAAPFIVQPLARRVRDEELGRKTLLFKAPGDAYRCGFYEQLFPRAKISYVHLRRGFAQTINGLLDSWGGQEEAFAAKPVGLYDEPLQIRDYSRSKVTRTYWCHDMPSSWRTLTHASLLEVAAAQWYEAHRSILENFLCSMHIAFEDLYRQPTHLKEQLATLAQHNLQYNWNQYVVPTDNPRAFRWKKRANILSDLELYIGATRYRELVNLQLLLGYSMDQSTWY